MGTKVQCKSYLPGYCSTRNLNEDTNNSWYYEKDETLSMHLYNNFMLDVVNGYSGYDKEMLKRTMLEHEAIFRKQVYELHRLYRIQTDLMDDLKVKEFYRFSLSCEVTEKTWQMPLLTTGNTSLNNASVASTNETRLSLSFLRENSLQSSPVPSRNGACLKDGDFLDNEDAERAEKENVVNSSFMETDPLNTIGGGECENDVKLNLSLGENYICRKGWWKSDSQPQNGLSGLSLDDLNEPTKGVCCEGEPGPAAARFLSVGTHHEGMQAHMLPNNRSHLQRDFFTDMHRDDGACSNIFSADEEETQEWPFIHNEVGQSKRDAKSFNPDLCDEKLLMLPKPLQLAQTRSVEIVTPDQNKTETWFRDKICNGTEIAGRIPQFANSIYSEPKAPQMLSPFSVLPHSDYSSTSSSPIQSRRRPTKSINHIPIAVQALPCFIGSTAMNVQSKSSFDIQNLDNACGRWQYNGGLPPVTFSIPNLNNQGDKSAYANSDGRGCRNSSKSLQHAGVKPAVDARLDHALTNGIQDHLTPQQDVEGNRQKLSGGIPWLRTKPACSGSSGMKECASQMESSFSQGNSPLMCHYDPVALEIKKKQEKGKGHSLSALEDFPPSLLVKDSRMRNNEESDNRNGERIIRFRILDKVQQNATYSPSTTDTSCSSEEQAHVVGSVTGNCVGNRNKGFRNDINLNSVISCMDLPSSSENSHDPSPLSLQSLGGKIFPEIDLEASVAAEAVENLISQEEDLATNHLPTPVQTPPSKTDGGKETECSHATLVRVAVENLVAMSSDVRGRSADPTRPSTPPSCVSLQWFAEIVSSSARASKGKGYGGAESSDGDDGLDYFESMTLKLEEMKADEFRYRPRELDNQKDEGTATASPLLTRPRRGRARRTRQRRDFQQEILPGLASLSRNEVTDDLQTIKGNWFPCQAKGRRRPRSLAVTVAEIRVNPTPAQPAQTELELDGRSIMGWGRRTRRCRGPRVPSGNASTLLT